MKSLFVILSLCVLAVYADEPNESGLDPVLVKCMKDARPDLSTKDLGSVDFKNLLTMDEKHCALACMFRAASNDSTSPLTEVIKHFEDDEDQVPKGETRMPKDLLEKVNQCAANKDLKTDCEIMKCIDFSVPPFSRIFAFGA